MNIIKIKIVVAVIYSLQGFIGLFAPGPVEVLLFILEWPISFWLMAVIFWLLLLQSSLCYFIGALLIRVLIPYWSKTIPATIGDKILPFVDITWLYIATCWTILVFFFFRLIHDVFTDSPYIWYNLLFSVLFLVWNIVMNGLVSSMLCTEQQKQYFLGPFIQGWMTALIRGRLHEEK